MLDNPPRSLLQTALLAGLILSIPAVATEAPDQGSVEAGVDAAGESDAALADSACCPGCRHGIHGWRGADDSESATGEGPRCRCGQGFAHKGEAMDTGTASGRPCHMKDSRWDDDRPANRPRWGEGAGPGHGYRVRGHRHGGHGRHQEEMATYRELLANHASIVRTVEDIPGGVRTVTTTADPELLETLRRHVEQMKALMESGDHIRIWDPLFAQIFAHADAIELTIEPVENGVVIVETSDDEAVASLIRGHARKVDQFIARGDDAYREATPLPEGYEAPGR